MLWFFACLINRLNIFCHSINDTAYTILTTICYLKATIE